MKKRSGQETHNALVKANGTTAEASESLRHLPRTLWQSDGSLNTIDTFVSALLTRHNNMPIHDLRTVSGLDPGLVPDCFCTGKYGKSYGTVE